MAILGPSDADRESVPERRVDFTPTRRSRRGVLPRSSFGTPLLAPVFHGATEHEEPMAKEPYRDPHSDHSTMYVAAGIATLAAFGVIVWALSDYTPVNPLAVQTEGVQPKETTPAQ